MTMSDHSVESLGVPCAGQRLDPKLREIPRSLMEIVVQCVHLQGGSMPASLLFEAYPPLRKRFFGSCSTALRSLANRKAGGGCKRC
ncbi:unnamed protein product [Amoebophrya sp. A25]|nr:unnamed protein product [Amoebophrya sp. A25]|eukprot:GSA25T00015268001.1